LALGTSTLLVWVTGMSRSSISWQPAQPVAATRDSLGSAIVGNPRRFMAATDGIR
jgi:hypothetical protein